MSKRVQLVEELRERLSTIADGEQKLVASLREALNRFDQKLLQDVRTITAERRRAVLVHVFPNGLISVYPDHMEFYRTFPDGPDRTRLEKLMCVPPAVASRPAFEAEMRQVVRGFEEIRDEDVAVCLAVQRGLAAGLAKASPLCYLEKPIWRFARWVDGQVRARRPRRLLGSPPESDMSEEPRARRRGTGKGGSSRSERRLGRRLRGGKSGGSSETPLKF